MRISRSFTLRARIALASVSTMSAIVLAFFVVSSFVTLPFAQNTTAVVPPDSCFAFSAGSITDYYDNEGNVQSNPACPRAVDIPSTIGGINVTTIGINAFASNQLTSVVVPATVSTIGGNAFGGNDIVSFTVQGNPASMNANALYDNPITSLSYNGTLYTAPVGPTQPVDACFTFTTVNGRIGSYRLFDLSLIKSSGVACMARDVIIPSQISAVNVQIIGSNSFQNRGITNVSIPNTVVNIGISAFQSNELSNITLPNSLTSISSSAFGYNRLTDVTIPSSLTSISAYTFSNNQLTNVTIPNTITSIGDGAFSQNELTSVTLPSVLASLGNSAFRLNQLTNIIIPNGVTSIESQTFYSNKLESIQLPNTVTIIGSSAFEENLLTSITIPSTVTTIGNSAFNDNALESLTIPDSVTSVGTSAFTFNQITELYISNSLTVLESNIFRNNRLTEVIIPDSVTTIENDSFSGNSIRNIIIPNSVTSIDDTAFSLQSSLHYDEVSDLMYGTYPCTPTCTDPTEETIAELYTKVWLVNLYTEDPSNPNNFIDVINYEYGEYTGDGDYEDLMIIGGYLVNPSSVTLQYVDSQDNELRSTMQIVGILPNQTLLSDYTISAIVDHLPTPDDFYNPTPAESTEQSDFLRNAYYRIGQVVSFTPPAISGYNTPDPVNGYVLGASSNTIEFVYTRNGASGAGTNGGTLAETGTDVKTISLIALASMVIGIFLINTSKRSVGMKL